MNKLASRRAFLRGKPLRKVHDAIRPPGAVSDQFDELCVQCGDCATACPESIISFDAQNWPVVKPGVSACTFCGDCATACSTGALRPELVAEWPWRARVEAASCLSMNAVSCRVCHDTCDHGAIAFKLLLGGRSEPVLDTDACTGCGACASACPANAVTFERCVPSSPEAKS